MDEMLNLSYDTMVRYFDMISKTGYMNDVDVERTALLLMLQEFMQEFAGYFSQDDYDAIYKIIQCLSEQACVIPMIGCKEIASMMSNYIGDTPVRVTETPDLRDTQNIHLRLINQL